LAYLVRQGSISARGKANYNLINGNPDGVPYKYSIGSAETAEPMFKGTETGESNQEDTGGHTPESATAACGNNGYFQG
jgi:hypothetical protein